MTDHIGGERWPSPASQSVFHRVGPQTQIGLDGVEYHSIQEAADQEPRRYQGSGGDVWRTRRAAGQFTKLRSEARTTMGRTGSFQRVRGKRLVHLLQRFTSNTSAGTSEIHSTGMAYKVSSSFRDVADTFLPKSEIVWRRMNPRRPRHLRLIAQYRHPQGHEADRPAWRVAFHAQRTRLSADSLFWPCCDHETGRISSAAWPGD